MFNGEKLARAVYACRTPVVSAVGHEIDYTILDFVADLRAATPTAAAELVLPDRNAMRAKLDTVRENLRFQVSRRLDLCYTEYTALLYSPGMQAIHRRLEREEERLGLLMQRLEDQTNAAIRRGDARLAQTAALLESLSPYRVLSRGYCVALRDGQSVQDGTSLAPGDRLRLIFRNAEAMCTVDQSARREFKVKKKQSFEEMLEELDDIVAQLSDEQTPLETALKLYAEAAQKIAACSTVLEDAKVRVEEIGKKMTEKTQEEQEEQDGTV